MKLTELVDHHRHHGLLEYAAVGIQAASPMMGTQGESCNRNHRVNTVVAEVVAYRRSSEIFCDIEGAQGFFYQFA